MLCQYKGWLEWIFLQYQSKPSLQPYIDKVASVILKGPQRLRQMIGYDPHSIVLPLSKQDIQVFQENTQWQIALSNFLGNIDCHYPKNKLFSFLQHHQWILPHKTSPNPLVNAVTCFTDGVKSFKAAYTTCSGLAKTFQTSFTSAQQNELIVRCIASSARLSKSSQYCY